jgi:hypothetical protein
MAVFVECWLIIIELLKDKNDDRLTKESFELCGVDFFQEIVNLSTPSNASKIREEEQIILY